MKEVEIVWDKVTAHSRFWSIIIFIGVLPAFCFYIGMKVQGIIDENSKIYTSSTQTVFNTEHAKTYLPDEMRAAPGSSADIASSTSPGAKSNVK
jgi:hypothetical protein